MAKKLYSGQYFGYFSLSDPAGIVFFQKVFDIAHQVLEDFIKQSDIGWDNWFNNLHWAAPLVHCESQFIFPLISGENIEVDLSLLKLGETSVSFSFAFRQGNIECCIVKTSHVFIKKDTKEKIPIPILIRNVLDKS
ncbi:MAG: thioesterase family protein [Bdellovibrionales bacterium]|nr:thioesterase family protein [Bdellovibrionales bacterium]